VGQPEPVAEGAAAIAPATAWTGRGTGPYARSPDGRWRTDVTQDSGVALVMIDDDGREQTIRLPRDPEATFQCAAFSGDSRVLATGSSDGGLQVWDLSAENIARSGIALRGHTKPVQYIEFDRSDHWLVSSSTHSIRLWENDVTKLIALARRATGRTLTADERAQYGIDEAWDARPAAANADRR
jgi:WD40 repeat protein